MKALVFAAGRGERMRPLTDATPKPLLRAGGHMLIEHHLVKFAAAGITDVVINISYLADQFPAALGDGSRYGLRIHYSEEGPVPLETGGGMRHALPLLGDAPFLAVSADIVSDCDYARLPREPAGLAHLVMVPNPDFHAAGDFWLADGCLNDQGHGERLTFGNIGVYRPALVARAAGRAFKLAPLLVRALHAGRVTGERYAGFWRNLGTPAQLAEFDGELRTGAHRG